MKKTGGRKYRDTLPLIDKGQAHIIKYVLFINQYFYYNNKIEQKARTVPSICASHKPYFITKIQLCSFLTNRNLGISQLISFDQY